MSPARSCNGCGRVTTSRYCSRCTHLDTGARGSTRADRRMRAAFIAAAAEQGRLVCAECGVPLLGGSDTHFDHTIAKRNGGSDRAENRQLLCQPCNLKKGAR